MRCLKQMRRLDREDDIDDVFSQMQKFVEQFQDFGKDMTSSFTGAVPVDVTEEDGHITVKADLPGVEKEEINVKADEEKIEIMAESSQEVKEENEKYYRKERSSRTFQRTVAWPKPVDPETVGAEYEDGVLKVTAEVSEEESGRDIEVE
ncbi:Hsp20 family protein [Candidatus Nanohaloarchaea archaeon]|nr:Hsp20 family protein [Candidatus Nanohaloarchaea archaeon]